MPKFSNDEKAKEARREVGQRKKVYQRLVTEGRMSEAEMNRKIELIGRDRRRLRSPG